MILVIFPISGNKGKKKFIIMKKKFCAEKLNFGLLPKYIARLGSWAGRWARLLGVQALGRRWARAGGRALARRRGRAGGRRARAGARGARQARGARGRRARRAGGRGAGTGRGARGGRLSCRGAAWACSWARLGVWCT